MQVYESKIFEDSKVTVNELATVIQYRLQGELSLKQVDAVLDALFKEIESCLKANIKVSLYGFGKFEMRRYQARTIKGGIEAGTYELPRRLSPAFQFSSRMRRKLTKPIY